MTSRTPLRIVHTLAPARYGGLETVVAALSSALIEGGDQVCVVPVFSPGDEVGHPLLHTLSELKVEVEPVVVPGRAYAQERSAVDAILRTRGAQLLHTHGYRADVIDGPVARRMGLPVVSTVHGYTGGGFRNRLNEWIQMRALRRFDGVIAVSAKLTGELRKARIPAERIHTLPNAWRPTAPPLDRETARDRLGLDERAKVVGWVGRMSEEKGPDVMIRALAEVRDTGVRVSMIGGGPLVEMCQALSRELGVQERVTWHGPVENAGLCLRAFDGLALTSWTEGTPMVLLEAMSSGVPIVATEVGGIPAVVSEAEAELCAAGETGEIARAIERIFVEAPAARVRVEAATKRLEDEFDVAAWARRHHAIYQSLLEVR